MKTDKELLELAARAVGISGPVGEMLGGDLYIANSQCSLGMWAPLTDDGDALRTAVKLHLSINFGIHGCQINVDKYDWADDSTIVDVSENGLNDPCAATRLAIVRAAAAIAESQIQVWEK